MSDSGIRPLRPSDTPPEVGNEMVEDVGNSPPVGGVGYEASRGGPKVSNDSTKIRRSYRKYSELPFNPKLKQRAKDLRKAGVLSEALMWKKLKKGQIEGLDFDRQKIIGSYIVDFFNANLGLVIEIDGSSHDDKQEYDEYRQAFLEGLGLIVVRYQDREVKNNMDGVITNLKEVCRELLDD